MIQTILNALFRCRHRKYTFPLTPVVKGQRGQCYVSCLGCGKSFPYDWEAQRIIKPGRKSNGGLMRQETITGGQQ